MKKRIVSKKKGQLLGQPIIMMFALVVGGMILIWGTWQIYQLIQFGCVAQVQDQVNKLKKDVRTFYYLEEGNSKPIKSGFPATMTHICFYNKGEAWNPSSIKPADLNSYKMVMEQSSEHNLFTFPQGACGEKSNFGIPSLKAGTANPLCFKTGQSMVLTSKGDHVEIS